MPAVAPALESLSLDITQEIHVRSSLEATFKALLEEMGPANQGRDGAPMPMVLEARPGGRWFRDLGDGNGHLWGHVQAIKQPTLLEISGPLMMSFAAANNVQYRLTPKDGGTLITLHHTALGLFPDGYRDELSKGFPLVLNRVKQRARVGRVVPLGGLVCVTSIRCCRSSTRRRRPRAACSSVSPTIAWGGNRIPRREPSANWRCTWRRCPDLSPALRASRRRRRFRPSALTRRRPRQPSCCRRSTRASPPPRRGSGR